MIHRPWLCTMEFNVAAVLVHPGMELEAQAHLPVALQQVAFVVELHYVVSGDLAQGPIEGVDPKGVLTGGPNADVAADAGIAPPSGQGPTGQHDVVHYLVRPVARSFRSAHGPRVRHQ